MKTDILLSAWGRALFGLNNRQHGTSNWPLKIRTIRPPNQKQHISHFYELLHVVRMRRESIIRRRIKDNDRVYSFSNFGFLKLFSCCWIDFWIFWKIGKPGRFDVFLKFAFSAEFFFIKATFRTLIETQIQTLFRLSEDLYEIVYKMKFWIWFCEIHDSWWIFQHFSHQMLI